MRDTSNKIVSAIAVTYAVHSQIDSCLESLKEQSYPPLEIIVIDNSLNPSFSYQISRRYPLAKVYSSPKNLFYCGALNWGLQMSKGEFILCLNDDVILDRKFIEQAIEAFDIDERIGMVSGKILRSDGKTLDSTGLFLSPWRTAEERGYGLIDRGQYEKREYVFGTNGAAAFYRRRMLEAIKIGPDYFDPDYHIFYEDLDIAWRAQSFGWKAYYIPSALAYHVRGATARSVSGIDRPYARRYLSDNLHLDLVKNRYLTILKNESPLGFILFLPFMFFYDFVVWAYVLFLRPRTIKKFLYCLRCLRSGLKKRRLIRRAKLQYFQRVKIK